MSDHQTVTQAFGLTSKELAEKVGDLRYDELERFFRDLAQKISEDSFADSSRGRVKLAAFLTTLEKRMHSAAVHTHIVWMHCKPYMK